MSTYLELQKTEQRVLLLTEFMTGIISELKSHTEILQQHATEDDKLLLHTLLNNHEELIQSHKASRMTFQQEMEKHKSEHLQDEITGSFKATSESIETTLRNLSRLERGTFQFLEKLTDKLHTFLTDIDQYSELVSRLPDLSAYPGEFYQDAKELNNYKSGILSVKNVLASLSKLYVDSETHFTHDIKVEPHEDKIQKVFAHYQTFLNQESEDIRKCIKRISQLADGVDLIKKSILSKSEMLQNRLKN